MVPSGWSGELIHQHEDNGAFFLNSVLAAYCLKFIDYCGYHTGLALGDKPNKMLACRSAFSADLPQASKVRQRPLVVEIDAVGDDNHTGIRDGRVERQSLSPA